MNNGVTVYPERTFIPKSTTKIPILIQRTLKLTKLSTNLTTRFQMPGKIIKENTGVSKAEVREGESVRKENKRVMGQGIE